MSRLRALACICLALLLTSIALRVMVRKALVALIAYITSISPPASLYLSALHLDARITCDHFVTSSREGNVVNSTRFVRVLEDLYQSEVTHLQRSVAQLTELLDEAREREARQKRRVQRKVGQERKLTAALSEQLTVAHASSAQARQRVFEISGVCSRVQGSNARLKAENDELRLVGGEVLDDNERLLADLHLAQCEAARYREEITRMEAALRDQEASARNVECSLREQLDRVKRSFASLEDIVGNTRVELSDRREELDALKARLAELTSDGNNYVSDFELDKTLFEADSLSELGTHSRADDDGHSLRKLGSEVSPFTQPPESVALTGSTRVSDELESTLERLRSLLPSTVTVRVVAVPPSSSSSLAALDLAYRRAAGQLSYEDLLALDFPSFSSLTSFDSGTCTFTSSLSNTSQAKSLIEEMPLLGSAISESQPSASTSAPSLPLFDDKANPGLDPFNTDSMLAIPSFRLTHSAPPSPHRMTRYALDLEYLCLQKSTSLPRAIDKLALSPLPRIEKLLDMKMLRKPPLSSRGTTRAHARACTTPLALSTFSSPTPSFPLFTDVDLPEADPVTADAMLAIPTFRLTSSAPPTPRKLSRSNRHLERMVMRASTSLPEPLDEILPEYDVHVPLRRGGGGKGLQERILDENVPWDSFAMSESLDEFDAVGVPPISRATDRSSGSV